MTTETNKAIVRKFFESMDKHDDATWQTLVAPNFVARMSGNEHPMDATQFKAMAGMFAAAFSNGRHNIESQVAEGDKVETRLVWTALHSGDFNGIPASGKPVRIDAVSLTRIAGGKIVEHRPLVDVMALMAQIGAIPAAA